MKRVLFFAILAFPSTLYAGQFSRTQVLMGDVPVQLTIQAPSSKKQAAFDAMDRAFDEARRLENSLSEWREGSQATLLNRNAGKALVPVDRDMLALLLKAREISEITDGAFDITFASCKDRASLHKMAPQAGCPYDYRDILVIPELGLAYLRPGVTIGVSGIAKGFIVDRMTAVLKKAGFGKFLVNAGDLYAAGQWKIGIRDPEQPGSDASICRLTVKDSAVSTSGQYERGPHILDPKTGKPDGARRSATVIARTSTDADALAKGFFILEKEKSGKILQERPDVEAVLVENDGSIDARNVNPKHNLRCRPF